MNTSTSIDMSFNFFKVESSMKYFWTVIILFYIFIFFLLPKPSFSAKIDELSGMAKQGQVEAQFTLAEAYYFGKGTGKNLQQALY